MAAACGMCGEVRVGSERANGSRLSHLVDRSAEPGPRHGQWRGENGSEDPRGIKGEELTGFRDWI